MGTGGEISQTDLARQQALDQVNWTIGELTANLLRMTRGAGRPHRIMQQINEFSAAIHSFWATAGHAPYADEFTIALNVSTSLDKLQHWSESSQVRDDAEYRIIRGVLQIVASRLVGQQAQESIGHTEMYDGINILADLRGEERKARTDPVKAAQPVVGEAGKAAGAHLTNDIAAAIGDWQIITVSAAVAQW